MAGLSEMRNQRLELPDVKSRSNEPWTPEEDSELRIRMAEGNTARAIATHFSRTTRAIRRRAERLKLSWRKAKGK
jgi:hypothetical protein